MIIFPSQEYEYKVKINKWQLLKIFPENTPIVGYPPVPYLFTLYKHFSMRSLSSIRLQMYTQTCSSFDTFSECVLLWACNRFENRLYEEKTP